MITTLRFSKKLLLVICLLIGLHAVRSVFPFLIALTGHVAYYDIFQIITYSSGAMLGLILSLNDRMSALKIIVLIILALFSPIEAGILYLILTFSHSADE